MVRCHDHTPIQTLSRSLTPYILAFTTTGDFVLGRNVAVLGELLDRGVKVALVYGDRDFQCNCKSYR